MDITTTAGPGPGNAVVQIAGELDVHTVGDVREVLGAAVGACRRVVVDLHDLTFCDCSGIGALVGASNTAIRRGVDLTVRNVPDHLARLLQLTSTLLPTAPAMLPSRHSMHGTAA